MLQFCVVSCVSVTVCLITQYRFPRYKQLKAYKKKVLSVFEKMAFNLKLYSFYHIASAPEVIKLFSYSTRLSMKFILLINVKMPTTVGILTFISMINTTSETLGARIFFSCRYFSFYEQLKFLCSVELSTKKVL